MKNSNPYIRKKYVIERSFEMKKSKIGVPKISALDSQDFQRGVRSRSTKDRYDADI
jgi:hypothetical protein